MIPMLFSTMMVQALLANRKTMTRRLKGLDAINKDPDAAVFNRFEVKLDNSLHAIFQVNGNDIAVKCPYGNIGDVLWVREKFRVNESQTGFPFHFYTDDDYTNKDSEKWKPSLFMPKAACRFFLEVTDIRLERLQRITEFDAISEGIQETGIADYPYKLYSGKKGEHSGCAKAIRSFESLWQAINSNWNLNPWVWVVCFKQVEKPVEFNTGR